MTAAAYASKDSLCVCLGSASKGMGPVASKPAHCGGSRRVTGISLLVAEGSSISDLSLGVRKLAGPAPEDTNRRSNSVQDEKNQEGAT